MSTPFPVAIFVLSPTETSTAVSAVEIIERHHIRQADYTIDKCVKHRSYYFGSMMLHEGRGFEGCRHLGTNFRNAHYNLDVDVEVSTVKEVIKTAEEISIKHSSAKSLIVTSNCLIRSGNRYAEKNLHVSPQ